MQLACSVSTNVGRQAEHPTFSPSCRNSFLFMAYMWLRTRRRKGSRLASKIFFAAVLVQSWRMGDEVRRMCHWWTIMTWARVVDGVEELCSEEARRPHSRGRTGRTDEQTRLQTGCRSGGGRPK